jgi:TRAP-type C4-dicarboxylate transport system permease small subunit
MVLQRFEHFVKLSSNWFAGLGIILILASLLMTFIDILSSKFLNLPVRGSIELTGLSQALIIASATAVTQLSRQHITVDILVQRFPVYARAILKCVISVVLFCLFIGIIYQLVANGLEAQKVGQYTSDLYIPIQIVIYLTALMLVPGCFVFFLEFLQSAREVRKR